MTLSHHVHNPTVYEYDMWTITDNSACWKALLKWIEKSQREVSYICWKPDLRLFIQHLIPFFHYEANAQLKKIKIFSNTVCCHNCDLLLKTFKYIREFKITRCLMVYFSIFTGLIFTFSVHLALFVPATTVSHSHTFFKKTAVTFILYDSAASFYITLSANIKLLCSSNTVLFYNVQFRGEKQAHWWRAGGSVFLCSRGRQWCRGRVGRWGGSASDCHVEEAHLAAVKEQQCSSIQGN